MDRGRSDIERLTHRARSSLHEGRDRKPTRQGDAKPKRRVIEEHRALAHRHTPDERNADLEIGLGIRDVADQRDRAAQPQRRLGAVDRRASVAEACADNLTITAQDAYNNTVTTYTGSHNLTFSGASSSPGGNAPTVANSAGTATAFGTATALNFTRGVASVASLQKRGDEDLPGRGGQRRGQRRPIATAPRCGHRRPPPPPNSSSPPPDRPRPPGAADNLTITAQDTYGNTVTTYTGSHNITFSGASAAAGGNAPTVANASGTAIAFGTATAITFTSGVAAVSGANNGVMKLYKAEAANLKVSDGTLEQRRR